MKSKNKFLYIIIFIIAIYSLSLSCLISYDLIKNRNYIVAKDPYFNSFEFDEEITSFSQNLCNLYIYYKDYNEKVGESKVTKEDLDGLRVYYEDQLKTSETEIQNKYNEYILNAEKSGDKNRVTALTNEKNEKLDSLRKENLKTEDQLKKEVALRYTKDYEDIKKVMETRKDIKYYINDTKNKKIYTNLPKGTNINEYLKSKSLYNISLPLNNLSNNIRFKQSHWIFSSSSWKGYIIIPKNLNSDSYILKNYHYYNSVRDRLLKECIIGSLSLILGISMLILLKNRKITSITILDKIKKVYFNLPLDLKIFIFVIYTVLMSTYLINISFFYKPLGIAHFTKLSFVSIYILYLIFNIKYAIKLKQNKDILSAEYKNSLIIKLLNKFKKSNLNKNIKFKIIFFIAFSALLGMFILLVLVLGIRNIFIAAVITIGYVFLIIRYLFKKADYLNEILKATEEIASGNLDYVIEEKGEETLSKIASNINSMKQGYKKSLEQQIKSERLKTELITNVSHDLKTPLTSIINYVNLLRDNDLTKEDTNAYIEILSRKSDRLKILIDDLFEASKMSSGSVDLNIEKVDVNSLLQQSIGELEEKIKEASLILRFKYNNKKIYANLDGKRTWRVFENLINNIIKYSQPNTRVYIDLIEKDNNIVVTMKNISNYEMNFNSDELFERFKRGDKSRNTDGSGLGLAIAKSIVELQGGTLNIQIDGDLFKVIVKFKKVMK
ncbi:histidine kinase dimerization/phospho-acceptor domain-containing protein [Clostridium acetireducens]|uniref:HAMP domain-containing sensor histidine kinase n=1 Tax=Clostridium acetireducens TaxID=76489 RepID=UPI003BFA7553